MLKGKLAKLGSRESIKFAFGEVDDMLDRAEKAANDIHDPETLKNLFRTFVDRVIVFDDEVEVDLKIITPTESGRSSLTDGSANETRTRVSALRGRCPRPLDDSAAYGCGTRTRT